MSKLNQNPFRPDFASDLELQYEITRLRSLNAELIEALQQTSVWLDSGVIVDGKSPEIVKSWVRAALAKAKGE